VQAAKLVVKSSIRERVAELKEAQSKKCEMTRDQLGQFPPAAAKKEACNRVKNGNWHIAGGFYQR
jgi:hypothetical protein